MPKPTIPPDTDETKSNTSEPTTSLADQTSETETQEAEEYVTQVKPVKDANGIVVAWEIFQVPKSQFDAQTKVVTGGMVASPPHMIDEFKAEAARKVDGLQATPEGSGVHITPVTGGANS